MNNKTPDSLRSSWGLGRAIDTLPDDGKPMRRERIINRLRNLDVQRSLGRIMQRARKWQQLRQTSHPMAEKCPVFVVGCNRSGTNMVCATIGKSPHGMSFQESEFSLAFNAYYLRADWIIERLIRITPAPVISFGSILDSQFTDHLLARFDGAKAIWIYRRFEDVANSIARMTWGEHLRNLVRWVSRGELEKLGSRGKRIDHETVRLFGNLFREDLSTEAIACLYWYMRNQLYFDLNLHTDGRVLLVQYEDTVQNKEWSIHRIFDFLGLPYDPSVTEDIFATSVGKHPWPGIDPTVEEVCAALQARFDRQYAATSHLAPVRVSVPAGRSEKTGEIVPVPTD